MREIELTREEFVESLKKQYVVRNGDDSFWDDFMGSLGEDVHADVLAGLLWSAIMQGYLKERE